MSRLLAFALGTAATLALAAPAAARDSSGPVQFDPGQYSTQMKGSVRGYDTYTYTLDLERGDQLAIEFSPNTASCYVNIYGVGAKIGRSQPWFNGATEGTRFSKPAPQTGTYQTQIYLADNDARTNATCSYSIIFTVLNPDGSGKIQGGSDGYSDEDLIETCRGEASSEYGVKPRYISVDNYVQKARRNFTVDGTADLGRQGREDFQCIFDSNREFREIVSN